MGAPQPGPAAATGEAPDPSRVQVVGFVFDEDGTHSLFVRKNRPPWMAGQLNGVGGKAEGDESPSETMSREFEEETGVLINSSAWRPVVTIGSDHGTVVHVFAVAHPMAHGVARSVTDEEILVRLVDPVPVDALPSLRWLVPLAHYVVFVQAMTLVGVEGRRVRAV